MNDLKGTMDFRSINKKWAKTADMKLLFKKYIFGNRQKVFIWNLINRFKEKGTGINA